MPLALKDWKRMVRTLISPRRGEVEIAVVGKYISLRDSYKSIYEALTHGGIANSVRVRIRMVESEDVEEKGAARLLKGVAGILIDRAFETHLKDGLPHRPWSWADTYPIARLEVPRGRRPDFEVTTEIVTAEPHFDGDTLTATWEATSSAPAPGTGVMMVTKGNSMSGSSSHCSTTTPVCTRKPSRRYSRYCRPTAIITTAVRARPCWISSPPALS